MKRFISFLICVIATWAFAPSLAQAGSGFYLSIELGSNFAPDLDITGTSNDRASVCDEFINPLFATVTQTAGYENYNCTGPHRGRGDDWENEFDSAQGILTGAALGYRLRDKFPDRVWGRFRLELEYFYRNTEYNQNSDVLDAGGASGDKLSQEIVTAVDRVGSITSHNLFGNLYFDFLNSSRFTPYVGFGVGVGFTDMDYGFLWARNPDPNAIATGAGLPNEDEIRRNLAGSTKQSGNRVFQHVVRLPGTVRVGLRAHRIDHPGGQGALGQFRFLQREWLRRGSAAQSPAQSAQRLERAGVGWAQDRRHRNVRGQREPEVPLLGDRRPRLFRWIAAALP